MKVSFHGSEINMEIEGVVHNGVVVPDQVLGLVEGTRVRIVPKEPSSEVLFGVQYADSEGSIVDSPEAPLPQEPFLTEEICAPCSIPWPKGTRVNAIHVDAPLPTTHDLPEEG
jgi:hypothetical protein